MNLLKPILDEINFARIITVGICMAVAYILKELKPYAGQILTKLQEYITLKVEESQYAAQLQLGYDIWRKVEEDFRVNDAITAEFNSKKDYFDELLLEKIPSLKQTDLDYIRQVVAGNENYDKIS